MDLMAIPNSCFTILFMKSENYKVNETAVVNIDMSTQFGE